MSLASAQVWALVVLACIIPGAGARAEVLQRLSGSHIRTRFIGNVLTDDIHWRETRVPGGKLLVEEMGSEASVGSWCIDSNRLCEMRPGVPRRVLRGLGRWRQGGAAPSQIPAPRRLSPSKISCHSPLVVYARAPMAVRRCLRQWIEPDR